jgi:hypothetical protein
VIGVRYQERVKEELSLYAEYLRFVDDEREREGRSVVCINYAPLPHFPSSPSFLLLDNDRLYRRWCNLVRSTYTRQTSALDKNGNQISSTQELTKDSLVGTLNGGGGPVAVSATPSADKKAIEGSAYFRPPLLWPDGPLDATHMANPKAIQKFIRYFAINIISNYYAIPPHLESALVALTDNVIYRSVSLLYLLSVSLILCRNIYEVTFYASLPAKRRIDAHWRRQCRLGKFIDPIQYAVPARYLGRKEPEAAASSKSLDASIHSDLSATSLVEQINHHRHSIHSLEPVTIDSIMVNGHTTSPTSPQEEFDNWDEESRSNERYSEFLSRNRTKPAPNTALSRFQVYDLVESGVDGDEQESEELIAETLSETLEMRGEGARVDQRKHSSTEFEEEKRLTATPSVDSLGGDATEAAPGSEAVGAPSTRSDSKSEEVTQLPKTRSHRSPSVERSEARKKSTGKRKSGTSSRFKKDTHCDAFLAAATLRSFEGRVGQLLVSEVLSPPPPHSEGDEKIERPPVPYAYAARVMGLIEIAVTPRVPSPPFTLFVFSLLTL